MIKAWIADVTPLYEDECYARYYEEVPDFRKRKADRLRIRSMKAQSIGAWVLWQKIRMKYGLPEDARFNLSHSGVFAMCAAEVDIGNAGKISVGCDVEKIGALKIKVARNYFCREEYEAILQEKPDDAQTELFYRYWVLKESFMKATGRGMALPANSFCIRMGEPPVLIRQPDEFPDRYYYREYRLPGVPYRMAVCATDENIDEELHTELAL